MTEQWKPIPENLAYGTRQDNMDDWKRLGSRRGHRRARGAAA